MLASAPGAPSKSACRPAEQLGLDRKVDAIDDFWRSLLSGESRSQPGISRRVPAQRDSRPAEFRVPAIEKWTEARRPVNVTNLWP